MGLTHTEHIPTITNNEIPKIKAKAVPPRTKSQVPTNQCFRNKRTLIYIVYTVYFLSYIVAYTLSDYS